MGTTLHALVERQETSDHRWVRVSSWSLGKDYALMLALRDQTEDDWPRDVADRSAPCNDFVRYWMDGNLTIANVDAPSPEWQALCASLLPLIRAGGSTRVLFIER